MRLRLAWTVAAFLPLSASLTHAQDAVDPVLALFREYRAALDRGDAPAAEIAAQAALDASEATNGPRTAVLALNLAILRLDMGNPVAAHAPALRAHTLAAADEGSGVDPLMAELVLGRAALALEGMPAVSALRDVVARAERRGGLEAQVYSAAVDLARTAFALGDYGIAREAWSLSSRLAASSLSEPEFARGVARTGEGAATFMQAIVAAVREADPNGVSVPALTTGAARDANEALTDALGLLRGYADATSTGALTRAQSVYAEALAWQEVLRARMQAQGAALPRAETRAAAVGTGVRCPVALVGAPPLVYSPEALGGVGIGAVVFRVTADAEGRIVDRVIAAAAPAGSFGEAVASIAEELRLEFAADAAPGCRDGTQYAPIAFFEESGRVVTTLGSLALWRAAGAGDSDPDGSLAELTVVGTTPQALRAEAELAEDAVFARFNEINSSDDFDIHCRSEVRTGTHIPQRVCAPAFLRDSQTAAARDTILAAQGSAIASGGQQRQMATASDRTLRLNDEMRRLAQEDERLLEAMQRLVELRAVETSAGAASE